MHSLGSGSPTTILWRDRKNKVMIQDVNGNGGDGWFSRSEPFILRFASLVLLAPSPNNTVARPENRWLREHTLSTTTFRLVLSHVVLIVVRYFRTFSFARVEPHSHI
jgi:hypothetical protein